MNAPRTVLTELLQLRPGVSAATAPEGDVSLFVAHRGENLGRLGPHELAIIRRLAGERQTQAELLAAAGSDAEAGSGAEAETVSRLLARLRRGGWLSRTLSYAGRPLVTVRPLAPEGPPPDDRQCTAPRLSRFAVIRRDSDGLVLESPLALVAVHLHDAAVVTLLHALAGTPESAGTGAGLPAEAGQELLDEMMRHGFVHPDPDAEEGELATRQWSHHDLWFHARSRYGRHDEATGATYWARGVFEPPRRPQPRPEQTVELYRPDLAKLCSHDRPFTAVLEARCSIREHDPLRPLTAEQLGEFLYRAARVRWSAEDGGQEVFDRPYPSGGRLHALELYPVVTQVTGLQAAMYRYDPQQHSLVRLPARERPVQRLVSQAMAGVGSSTPPQVLILVAARFGATMWKYESIGYALLLKEVGVLFQTMYTVATAMGLAPCALGTGDCDLFARATGLPYLTESTVGEFVLGSRPGDASSTPWEAEG